MQKHLFLLALVLAICANKTMGQYYKVLYSVPTGEASICLPAKSLVSWAPQNYNPFDLENNGKTEIVIAHYDTSNIAFTILDVSTFNKMYDINKRYVFNLDTIILGGYNFLGFYDIDGDNEREAVFMPPPAWTMSDLVILNVKTQTIEWRGNHNDYLYPPFFADINNDGYIELITSNYILGHSPTPISTTAPFIAKKSSLAFASYPSPARSFAKINFSVPFPSLVDIAIYNTAGKLVKQLVNERRKEGSYSEIWNGSSDKNETVAPGEYYYNVKVGELREVKQQILLR